MGFALSNSLSALLDKEPQCFTRNDLLDVVERHSIERLTFHYTALDGKLKELRIPLTSRAQAERILADGERVDGSSLFKGIVDPALSDLYVVPVYKSAFINPFDTRSLDFVCRYLTREGEWAPFALDTILHRAAKVFNKQTGLDLRALGELEFFLLSEPKSSIYYSPKQKGYHTSAPFMKSGEILNEMARSIAQCTGAVKYVHSEVGCVESVRSDLEEIAGRQAEQLEVEFLPAPVEDAADFLVLARWIIRTVAYNHNCVATFTPKLEEGIAGNGLHVHLEAVCNGRNVMTNEDGTLSETTRRMIGGLCAYADSLTAFGNTVSAAYLRLVPNQEAPTRICWSDMNRSAMIRVPLGWGCVNNLAAKVNPQQENPPLEAMGRQTVELRSPDGSAIVHLLLAGITLAAEWGLTHEESLRLAERFYVSGNVLDNNKDAASLPGLPKSCVESSRILLQKRELYERMNVFPPSVINYIAHLLAAEDDEAMNRHLMDLPADDRLHETRKIMHRDIHRH